MNNNITVALRVRPLITIEADFAWNVDTNNICLYPNYANNQTSINQQFEFSTILPQTMTTQQMYSDHITLLTQKLLSGMNSTVMAYGQSGSGKTFTTFGTPGENNGLSHYILNEIFQSIPIESCRIRMQFVELYNEQFSDLLSTQKNNNQIQIKEENGQISLSDTTQITLQSIEQFNQVIERANTKRTVAETNLNSQSSRSHAIIRLILDLNEEQTINVPLIPRNGRTLQKYQKQAILNIIDLAGSEKIAKTNATGVRLKEAQNINKSLLTLGMVINALSTGQPHIPYRDSKLTRLLQQSLGGQCLTTIIGCISPAQCNIEESINTLRFCSRAMKVVNKEQTSKLEKLSEGQHIDKLVIQNKQLKQRIQELEQFSQNSNQFSVFNMSQVQGSNVSLCQQDVIELEKYRRESNDIIKLDQLFLLQQQMEEQFGLREQKLQDKYERMQRELQVEQQLLQFSETQKVVLHEDKQIITDQLAENEYTTNQMQTDILSLNDFEQQQGCSIFLQKTGSNQTDKIEQLNMDIQTDAINESLELSHENTAIFNFTANQTCRQSIDKTGAQNFQLSTIIQLLESGTQTDLLQFVSQPVQTDINMLQTDRQLQKDSYFDTVDDLIRELQRLYSRLLLTDKDKAAKYLLLIDQVRKAPLVQQENSLMRDRVSELERQLSGSIGLTASNSDQLRISGSANLQQPSDAQNQIVQLENKIEEMQNVHQLEILKAKKDLELVIKISRDREAKQVSSAQSAIQKLSQKIAYLEKQVQPNAIAMPIIPKK